MTQAALNKHISQLADKDNNPLVGPAQSAITSFTDSTGGTAGDTLDDTTASVKDDLASIAAKVNAILDVLAAHGLIKVA